MSSCIEFSDVRFAYPGQKTKAVHGVSLTIEQGRYVCILGGNGSGKSTLLQLMNALLVPTAGTACVLGLDSTIPGNTRRIRQRAAMVFQHPEDQMVANVVADDVAFGPENLGVAQPEIALRVTQALAAVDMASRSGADPADLSGGQKQRVAIAGALAMQPSILLLDEPSAMLDTQGRQSVQQIISSLRDQHITIVHVTHFMEDALDADRVIVMERGHIALDGTPTEIFARRKRLSELGLEMPFALRLAGRLAERGFSVPAATDESELAASLAKALRTEKLKTGTASAQIKNPANSWENPSASPSTTSPAVSFEHVSFSYAEAASPRKRRKRPPRSTSELAVRDLNFTVAHGSLTALVGRTGSGKSTTAELACALKLPRAGTVRVAGIDTADIRRRPDLRRLVGYVSQLPERQLFAQTVYDDVAFGPRNLGLSEDEVDCRVREALRTVGLPTDKPFLGQSPFALSGGQQRGVALAGILAMRQPVLVLDEPMAGLDPAGRTQARALLCRLKQQGTAILLVTHSMDDAAELADQVIVLDNGRLVVQGTPRQVFCAENPSACSAIGEPRPLAFARKLATCGVELPDLPLTMDELVSAIVNTKGVSLDGASR